MGAGRALADQTLPIAPGRVGLGTGAGGETEA